MYGAMAIGYEIIQKNDPVDFETICHSVSKNNAEHIVKCVNSHDELLESAKLSLDAMKQANQELESFNYLNNDKNILPSSTSNLEEAIEWIEKAIQKAEGK